MKIYTASPLPVTSDSWQRDITVLYRGFAALGHDAACVRLHSTDGSDFPGVIQVSLDNMRSAAWWNKQKCDLVVINSWGMPVHTPIVRAIKESGAKVVVRLDTHGYNSPWAGGLPYYQVAKCRFLERGMKQPMAEFAALIKTVIYTLPVVHDKKMLQHLSLADLVGIESEGARKVFSRILALYGRNDLIKKMTIIRHPVTPEIVHVEVFPAKKRARQIVCVGRWDSPQKDAALLMSTLCEAMGGNPSWIAKLYGKGENVLQSMVGTFPEAVARRIEILGQSAHMQVLDSLAQSKILLFSSRFESGPIAAAEALCLGCSVVGAPSVPSTLDLCHQDYGTLPHSRNSHDMAKALQREMKLWDIEQRNPAAIAQKARTTFTPQAVCKQIADLF